MSAVKVMKDAAGAVAILSVCTLLYWPRQATRPPTRDMGPPPVIYVPAVVPASEPAPSCPAETTTPAPLAESKTCNPACVYPEKCVEGTCCRPASGASPHSELIVNTRFRNH